MRIDKQNRLSCLALLAVLAVLGAVSLWLFLDAPTSAPTQGTVAPAAAPTGPTPPR